MNLSECYIHVGDDELTKKRVQLILFFYGYSWYNDSNFLDSCGDYFYLTEKYQIFHNFGKTSVSPYCNYKEITLEEVLKL